MPERQITPYGSWKSPLAASRVAAAQVMLGQVEVSEGAVYWTESRPEEGGRVAIMKIARGEDPIEVTPQGFNCRTRVHEYGGGAYLVQGSTLYCSRFEDQRLYRIEPDSEPFPITPQPEIPAGLRYADGRMLPGKNALICVREDHGRDREPMNELVAVAPHGQWAPRVLHTGRDFYSSPRISPDGKRLAWLAWDHPHMPWEGSELWLADLSPEGEIGEARRVAGGESESIFQPEWSPQGRLHFVSDRSGWWNLFQVSDDEIAPLVDTEAEFGSPQWIFGLSRYAFIGQGRLAAIYTRQGIDRLALVTPEGELRPLDLAFNSFRPASLKYDPASRRLVFIAASPQTGPAVISLDPETGEERILRSGSASALGQGFVSTPRTIEFPAAGGRTAHAFFYPPTSQDFEGPEEELPPLIVVSHGGPTSQARPELNLSVQYWTTRGFALVDVNYGGSTGYGRGYRDRLAGQWGVVDVEDCIQAALYLAKQGEADRDRLIIRGGSAGGYTTLSALAFHRTFAAGASYYGVADVEALALETHKFESRYLDSLIGPYPQAAELYRQRSPIHFVDRLSCPVILFQGQEDKVVPPAQAETIVAALQAAGLPYAYLSFAQEAHGFRAAENIQRALEAELYFYARIFRFELADEVEPVEIENL